MSEEQNQDQTAGDLNAVEQRILQEAGYDQQEGGGEGVENAPEAPSVPQKFLNEDGSVNTDALFKSYAELEKRLGAGSSQEGEAAAEGSSGEEAEAGTGDAEETPEAGADPVRAEVEGEVSQAGFDWDTLAAEVDANGDLSDETYAKLAEANGKSEAFYRSIVRGIRAENELVETKVLAEVGGQEQLTQLQQWATQHLSKAQKQLFNQEISSRDPERAIGVINLVKAQMAAQQGTRPANTVQGGANQAAAAGGLEPYVDNREAARDQLDPRYGSDTRFTQQVNQRLTISRQAGTL